MSEPTPISEEHAGGEPRAAEELLPLVYTELRRLAARRMAQEKPGQTLQATALVHEAWLRLAGEENREWKNRQHFFCAAATAMRRILIDNARRKETPKHGGDLHRVDFDDISPAASMPSDELLAMDDALEQLATTEPRAAQLVELRFFVGMGHQEAAQIMGIGRKQADRLWTYARARLLKTLKQDFSANSGPISP